MIYATCGHEITIKQMEKGYWWKTWENEGEALAFGCLCRKCVKPFGAISAKGYEEARRKLSELG